MPVGMTKNNAIPCDASSSKGMKVDSLASTPVEPDKVFALQESRGSATDTSGKSVQSKTHSNEAMLETAANLFCHRWVSSPGVSSNLVRSFRPGGRIVRARDAPCGSCCERVEWFDFCSDFHEWDSSSSGRSTSNGCSTLFLAALSALAGRVIRVPPA
mmetsp:Transcript_908/g.2137  ORF Transcript_908/g.2137 Transcript_908/m.2137 type:complete len:158 (+) Transcript_908:340-813(+)